jgi:hypothetical protein
MFGTLVKRNRELDRLEYLVNTNTNGGELARQAPPHPWCHTHGPCNSPLS